MFVEQVFWSVPSRLKDSSLQLLGAQHRDMGSSGGLITSLLGFEEGCQDNLISLSFWKSWEDLGRFLSGPKANLLTASSETHRLERPHPHHFEIVWEWPGDEVDTISGSAHWAFHDFWSEDGKFDRLIEDLRSVVIELSHKEGIVSAGIWLNKNAHTHLALATQWREDSPPTKETLELPLKAEELNVKESRVGVFKLSQTDSFHAQAR